MSESDQINDFFDTLAKVLLRTWIFGYVVLLAWAGLVLFVKPSWYGLLSNWYGLTSHELDLTNYCGIALLKLLVIVFFLFPWLAIRLVLRSRTA
jgi:hypothetical protein